jgi:hypothetical protein
VLAKRAPDALEAGMWRHSKNELFLSAGIILGLFLLITRGAVSAAGGFQTPELVPPAISNLSANQLDDLVDPVALYPDPLLSQVLVACTYPLEIVEAVQWLQRNPTLSGSALANAVAEQNWDPSVQALVVFPDLIKRLSEDIIWTTNLGNAFLAQQSDVMDAVQRARAKAQQLERLSSTPQQTVTTTVDSGRSYITIAPAEPQVIFVPVYDPVWIWGPYVYYRYPRWHYPARPVGPIVVIFGPPIIITNFFAGPWIGWSAWGWYPIWGTHAIFVNNVFVHRYHFNGVRFPATVGTNVWSHDPFHRQGVPYPNRMMTEQYRAATRENLRPHLPLPSRERAPRLAPSPVPAPKRNDRIGNRTVPANPQPKNPGAFGGIENGNKARQNTNRGHASMDKARPAPPRSH